MGQTEEICLSYKCYTPVHHHGTLEAQSAIGDGKICKSLILQLQKTVLIQIKLENTNYCYSLHLGWHYYCTPLLSWGSAKCFAESHVNFSLLLSDPTLKQQSPERVTSLLWPLLVDGIIGLCVFPHKQIVALRSLLALTDTDISSRPRLEYASFFWDISGNFESNRIQYEASNEECINQHNQENDLLTTTIQWLVNMYSMKQNLPWNCSKVS